MTMSNQYEDAKAIAEFLAVPGQASHSGPLAVNETTQAAIMRERGLNTTINPAHGVLGAPPFKFDPTRPTVFVERIAEDKATYEVDHIPSEQAKRIVYDVLPNALQHFLEKNKDYADWPNLGDKGEFVEIWRKVHKLKSSLWEGKPLVGEQTKEILTDLLGHILLALDSSYTDGGKVD